MRISYMLALVWTLVLCAHGLVVAGLGLALRRLLHDQQQADLELAGLFSIAWFGSQVFFPIIGEGVLSIRRHVDAMMNWLVDCLDLTR